MSGRVHDRDHGSAEALFEGLADAVEAIFGWCRSGPDGTQVEHMDVTLEERPDGFEGFEVRRADSLQNCRKVVTRGC